MNVSLRSVEKNDLDIFFENHQDKEANYIAAFTSEDPSDRGAFEKHWQKLFSTRK